MKLLLFTTVVCTIPSYAQIQKDSTKQKEINEIQLVKKKPTVENKVDRTVFNVANSTILAGNTTWDVLRMTPLVSIDNNDVIKAEGESVTVYINDRKSVFTGKELKEYLKTISAENLMKIEVITSPSARYETNGAVINIVLKKLENEGYKGNLSLTNNQSKKNNQYSSLNVNFHKKNFTQTLSSSYSDYISVLETFNYNVLFANNLVTKINTESFYEGKTPSFSSTSEYEVNDKNTLGIILEYSHTHKGSNSNAYGDSYINNLPENSYVQTQYLSGINRNFGNNIFYKYYDKPKNKILDLNIGVNYSGVNDTKEYILNQAINPLVSGNKIDQENENREYYLKADYSQPIAKNGNNLEFGGKMNFKNYVIPYNYFKLSNNLWINDNTRSNSFHYHENLNALYVNYSNTFFKKLETRIGLRFENIQYKIRQEVGNIEKTVSYNSLLPDLLLKYSFSDNYNLSATYNRNIWRPFYSEFNPFLLPNDNGIYYRGNMELQPNPSNRIGLKLGLYKKYFISTSYWFTKHDYWDTFYIEDDKTITMPTNFDGKVLKLSANISTNQTFLKNDLTINLNIGANYTDSSDFNKKNNLTVKNYITNFNGSMNITYNNILKKNININAWAGVFTQNYGNSYANNTNVYHTISITKLFPKTEMEASISFNNIFQKPNYDNTVYSPIGTFRTSSKWDFHGISLTFIKRFGNQKVKENTKTSVEKENTGSK